MPFITKEGLQQLDKYKYVGGSYSYLDNKMNVFWIKLSEYLPMNIAPNMITFIGFLFMISSYITILFYDMTLTKQIPNWLFLKAGIEVFLYQTLDALDGKQARRTKSSSPLGQLFDHGCDSYTLTFIFLCVAQACQLDSQISFYLFLGAQLLMFQANWIEYHTHVLNTQYGNFGVTETQFIAIILLLVAGIFGQQSIMLPVVSLLPGFVSEMMQNSSYKILNEMVTLSIGNFCGYIVIGFFICVTLGTFITTISGFKGSKKITNTLQYLPLIQSVFVVWQWCHTSLFKDYAGLMILSFGILFSTLTCKVITCSLTKMPLRSFHIPTIAYALGLVVHFYGNFDLGNDGLLYMFIGLSVFNILYSYVFVHGVINQITAYLGIYCFSLEKRERQKLE